MIEIFVDGSCSFNGEENNYGGMGIVLVKDGEVLKTFSIPSKNTTNNRMEMSAMIYAVQIAKMLNETHPQEIIIYSDSQYAVETANDWMYRWAKNGWMKYDKKTPENLDLVKALHGLMNFERAIKIEKIKGHAGHEFNEMADKLATAATAKAREEDA